MRAEVLFSNFMAEHNILFLHWLHRLHIASPDSVRPCSLTASSPPCLPVVAPRQHKSSSIPLHHSYIKKSWNICNPVPSPQPMVRATTEIVTRPCPYYCNISQTDHNQLLCHAHLQHQYCSKHNRCSSTTTSHSPTSSPSCPTTAV